MKGTLNPEIASIFPGGTERIEVSAIAGDELLNRFDDFSRILLKIDVVGAEADVLASLSRLITEKRPDIVVGVWSENLKGLNELHLQGQGYELFKIERGGLASRETFLDSTYCNYFLSSPPAR